MLTFGDQYVSPAVRPGRVARASGPEGAGRVRASLYLARASVEMTSATRCIRPVSQVAASPIAWGKTVARPWATPCSASFHQL